MTIYAYSPDTGELIRTDTVADWMGTTEVPPPDFNPVTAGCFWRGDQWELEAAAAPEVPTITVFSVREFRARFTIEEQLAIRAASFTDHEVGLVYDEFLSAQYIDLDDSAVGQGIDLYTFKGLLDPSRKAELLAPLIPE